MKKIIHIATLWNAFNYGAYLQAYALRSFCLQLGFNVFFLEECKERRTYLAELSTNIKKAMYQLRIHKKYLFAQNQFKIASCSDKADITIVGADEIWNVNNKFFKHDAVYIGRDTNTLHNLSYAACANGASASAFKAVYGENPFAELQYISVRDDSTKQLAEALFHNKNVIKVLDPTFLLENYDALIETLPYKKYVFVYGYLFAEDTIDQIKNYASANALKIVSAGTYHNWTDIQVPASPGEFLGLVKNADFVVTSTFHGTVFSIIFNKQFASFCNNNRKVVELLDDFSLVNRDISERKLLDISSSYIDYSVVNEKISNLRRKSIDYLINSVHNKGYE